MGFIFMGAFSKWGLRPVLDSIYELFPLVQQQSCLSGKKACIFYQINRCLAPCEGRVSRDEYFDILNLAKESLENIDCFIEKLKFRVKGFSDEEEG